MMKPPPFKARNLPSCPAAATNAFRLNRVSGGVLKSGLG